ncbi:MAG: hypothetical protein AVDCRST_MAG13-3022, partial [uncultured Solirubrobacteraceae bacterium]
APHPVRRHRSPHRAPAPRVRRSAGGGRRPRSLHGRVAGAVAGLPRGRPRGHALPAQPGARGAGPRGPAVQRVAAGRRLALRRADVAAGLLRPRGPRRLLHGRPHPPHGLPARLRPALDGRREPRVGRRPSRHPGADRRRVDGLPGPQGEHPLARLRRDRDRRHPRRPRPRPVRRRDLRHELRRADPL